MNVSIQLFYGIKTSTALGSGACDLTAISYQMEQRVSRTTEHQWKTTHNPFAFFDGTLVADVSTDVVADKARWRRRREATNATASKYSWIVVDGYVNDVTIKEFTKIPVCTITTIHWLPIWWRWRWGWWWRWWMMTMTIVIVKVCIWRWMVMGRRHTAR